MQEIRSRHELVCRRERTPLKQMGCLSVHEFQDLAQTTLIHANAQWRDRVTAHLWPYAPIRTANEAVKHTPSFQDQQTPIELFTGSKVASNHKH